MFSLKPLQFLYLIFFWGGGGGGGGGCLTKFDQIIVNTILWQSLSPVSQTEVWNLAYF